MWFGQKMCVFEKQVYTTREVCYDVIKDIRTDFKEVYA